jgi:hypothetical protein
LWPELQGDNPAILYLERGSEHHLLSATTKSRGRVMADLSRVDIFKKPLTTKKKHVSTITTKDALSTATALVSRIRRVRTAAPELASGTAKVPLDETRVEFDGDKIDQIVNDVRDHAHLNGRRATQGKYE